MFLGECHAMHCTALQMSEFKLLHHRTAGSEALLARVADFVLTCVGNASIKAQHAAVAIAAHCGHCRRALPCPALPCPALPCPALPCPAAKFRLHALFAFSFNRFAIAPSASLPSFTHSGPMRYVLQAEMHRLSHVPDVSAGIGWLNQSVLKCRDPVGLARCC